MRIIVDSHIPFIQGLIEPFSKVDYLEPGDITASAVRDADALIVRTRTRCDASLLDGSRVRFIGSATIGTDHIDLGYCASHGITVRNAPGCNAPAVAQWIFCAIDAWMRQRGISTPDGLTLGIVGVGHIGSIVARWGRALGFTVLLNDPPREMAEKTENTDGTGTVFEESFLPLKELQRRCDIITFHTPLTREGQWPTWHLCDQAFVDGLTRCRLLLNASRGSVVDNAALLHWHGDIGLDCWENEPNILLGLLEKAIVATPHIAGYSAEGKQRGTAMMLEALNAFYGWDIPVPEIAAPATGAANVTLDGIATSYDIMADTARLKAAPSGFESSRNNYHHRPEYQEL
ncbi:MAG: 4-phosphoerythronate dehydrogenase [Muribaculaceae bacterium]|nr:4-phosphoerythronate dehydrogenase [Muribaculaceae bacterium]